MIRNEAEYQIACARLKKEQAMLAEQRGRGAEDGICEQAGRDSDLIESSHLRLKEDLERYERMKRREFDDLHNLRGFGHLLIALRVAKGVSQRELARRLGVHESQVSCDERSEYMGITLKRAIKILDALNVCLRTTVEAAPECESRDMMICAASSQRQMPCEASEDRHFECSESFE